MNRRAFLGGLAVAPLSANEPETFLKLEVKKTGLLAGKTHQFTFARFGGTVRGGTEDLGSVKVDFHIDADSISCRDSWVKESDRAKIIAYTKGERMLNVGTYPELRFTSSTLEPDGSPDSYRLRGSLTIVGVSQPAFIAIRRSSSNFWTGRAAVRMSGFGLKPPTAALGAIGTADQMDFTFRLPISLLRQNSK